MPRPPKDYSKPVPYVPSTPPVFGSSPEEVIRAVWDEFSRIQSVLAQKADAAPVLREGESPP